VQQAEVHEQEECCGFGGLFSVKNAEISGGMLDRKIAAIEASGADRVVSCDLGCLLHIGGGLHRRGSAIRVQHLAQLLDEAL
jgi:L-lactate dehydrogenase complex protein LldE